MTGEKSGEFRGKSVEAAVATGLAALRLTREEVEVEIVRPGSRGVLGIGAEDAVVRLTAIPRGASRPAPRTEPAPEPRPAEPRAAEPRPAPRTERQETRTSQPRAEAKAPVAATAAAPLTGTPDASKSVSACAAR